MLFIPNSRIKLCGFLTFVGIEFRHGVYGGLAQLVRAVRS